MRMARTTIDIDPDALAEARAEMGTNGISETVNSALRRIKRDRLRREFSIRSLEIEMTPDEIDAGRAQRG